MDGKRKGELPLESFYGAFLEMAQIISELAIWPHLNAGEGRKYKLDVYGARKGERGYWCILETLTWNYVQRPKS